MLCSRGLLSYYTCRHATVAVRCSRQKHDFRWLRFLYILARRERKPIGAVERVQFRWRGLQLSNEGLPRRQTGTGFCYEKTNVAVEQLVVYWDDISTCREYQLKAEFYLSKEWTRAFVVTEPHLYRRIKLFSVRKLSGEGYVYDFLRITSLLRYLAEEKTKRSPPETETFLTLVSRWACGEMDITEASFWLKCFRCWLADIW